MGKHEKAWESESAGEWSLKNMLLRLRDEVQGWDLRLQQDSDMKGEVLLYFLVCTGEYIYNVKFKNEKLTTGKFYRLSKGPETCMKIQLLKLLYPTHNACSAIAWPNCWANVRPSNMLTWPCIFDVPVHSNSYWIVYAHASTFLAQCIYNGRESVYRPFCIYQKQYI